MNGNLQELDVLRNDLRKRVISVAMKAFYSKGVKNVTMDEIAHELTMSKRTLYQIFSDKEALLLACIEEEKRNHSERMEERMMKTNDVLEIILFDFGARLENLKGVNPLFFAELSKFPKIVERMKADRLQHMEKAVAFMQRGVEQGLFRKDVDFRIIFTLLMNHIDSVATVQGISEFAPIEVFKHLVFFYLRGCTTPRGMSMMDEFLAKES